MTDSDSTLMMACTKCREAKPASAEFFHFDKRRSSLKKHCILCQRAMCKKHYEANKDSYHARSRAFEKANPQWQSDRNKKYREENREKINLRLKNRRNSEGLYYLERRTRVLIGDTIRRKGFTKRHGAALILGCTWKEFSIHLERQFVKGMSWDNRELWHIDHIVPIASASTEEEVIRLNHFTNLRPIWAKDNLSKGAQITHLI